MISSLELARICDVSQGTVDRALHNRSGISAVTREKILKAAQEYGYRPHPGAMEILGKTSNTIGCVIPSINNIFFMDMLNTIRTGICALDKRFVITPVGNSAEMLDVLQDFSARRCSAVLIIPPEDNIPIPPDITRNTVVISLLSPCSGENTHFLSPDEETAGRDAAAYLISKGHRRILHLTYSRNAYAIKARDCGYARAMKNHNLNPVTLIEKEVTCLPDLIQRQKATAIFCHNDWLALTAIRILTEAGLHVPKDVSVLGVDNSPTFTSLYPDITTLEYPSEWIRDQAVRIISGKKPLRKQIRFRIIERASTAENSKRNWAWLLSVML